MPRGGRRKGAGAPKMNLNNFKRGNKSRQLQSALFTDGSQEWNNFLSRLPDNKCRLRARTVAALLFIRST